MMAPFRIPLVLALSAGVSLANSGFIEPASEGELELGLETRQGFDWTAAAEQSFFFLTFQHAFRLSQEKTVDELKGPFFSDYWSSVQGLKTWRDGDSGFTNYVAHPMQGAVAGYIQIQNDPRGASLQFSGDPEYWKSRLRATGWSALYSTQFELGLYSEATIGNVGMRPGTMGYVDLVMTPVGGLGWMVGEDALDRFLVEPMERKWNNRGLTRFLRMTLSPTRSFANVLRMQKPWKRDGRP
jgi:hypothetical protein